MFDYKFLKQTAGDGNMKHFMDMRNLRTYKPDVYTEAKQISHTFEANAQQKWEEKQKGKGGKS